MERHIYETKEYFANNEEYEDFMDDLKAFILDDGSLTDGLGG